MIGRVVLLALGCLVVWGGLAYPAWLAGGNAGLLQTAVAAGICLVPAAITLAWGRLVLRHAPEQVFILLVGSLLVRMALVFAAGILLCMVLPALNHRAFWLWIVTFYVVTLALEITLMLCGHTGTARMRIEENP